MFKTQTRKRVCVINLYLAELLYKNIFMEKDICIFAEDLINELPSYPRSRMTQAEIGNWGYVLRGKTATKTFVG